MDALDRALSAALDVDPSPEFVARVRERIAHEPPPSRWGMSGLPRVPRLLMAAGAALAVVVVAVQMNSRREPLSAPAPAVTGTGVAVQALAPAVENVETVVPAARRRRAGVRVRRPPAVIQLVSIHELPDAPSGVVVAAMRFDEAATRFDEVVTMTGVHP
jgi:hypothetical protein